MDSTTQAVDVAASMCILLEVPKDARAQAAAEAAVAWARRRRSRTDPDRLLEDPDVSYGTVLYASLLYQSRATPLGMSGFDESALYNPSAPAALHRARELVGLQPSVA